MMRRIARLLQDGVVPRRILAVSFTRTAARDLREQLSGLDVPGADEVRATTLHSLCFSILSSQEAFAFNQRTPRPLMSFEIGCLENDLAGSFGGPEEQANQLDEQRRLFYVAITRAISVLVISSAIALPLRDALRGGANVTRRTFVNGEPFAITAFTPFLGELGPTAPAPISTAEWRRRSGLP